MAQLIDEQQTKLNRLKFNYESQITSFECIKALPGVLNILGKKIGPLKVKGTYKMEYFIGKILILNGFLKTVEPMDSKFVERIGYGESTTQEILNLEKNTFIRMQSEIELLYKMRQQNMIPDVTYKQYWSKSFDFLRLRLNKILKVASLNRTQQKQKMVSDEEEILFNTIAESIETFHEFFNPEKDSKD